MLFLGHEGSRLRVVRPSMDLMEGYGGGGDVMEMEKEEELGMVHA